ncbi:MAG: Clp protease N-terminal domain-containing protein [Planctomycetota bacterium]
MQPQYTNRSQAALAAAQELATSAGHPELTPTHLAVALLAEPEGVMSAVLAKLGVDPKALEHELSQALAKLPRSSGGAIGASRALAEVLSEAAAAAAKRSDEFVSTEHLLLALARKGSPEVAGLFAARDAGPERIEAALDEVRGDRKVTTPDPEATFDALEKYARDLTEDARAQKLDPVIGRDV